MVGIVDARTMLDVKEKKEREIQSLVCTVIAILCSHLLSLLCVVVKQTVILSCLWASTTGSGWIERLTREKSWRRREIFGLLGMPWRRYKVEEEGESGRNRTRASQRRSLLALSNRTGMKRIEKLHRQQRWRRRHIVGLSMKFTVGERERGWGREREKALYVRW